MSDTLVFTAVKFSAEKFVKQGFAAVEFEANTPRSGPATFTAKQSSDKAGQLSGRARPSPTR